MKGQTFEILAFVILAIAIIGVILMMRVSSVTGFGNTLGSISERTVHEGVNAGVNSLFFMTESKSGKSIQELVGIAAYIGNKEIDLGPGVGVIELDKEIEWRLDAMYGKGKWFVKIPYSEVEPDIQIVFVLDVSASLCDDIKEMSDNLPGIIQNLHNNGKRVSATIYLLQGGTPCCDYTIGCDKFSESSYIHCVSLESAKCPGLGSAGQTEEDWGNGIACASESGPIEGWKDYSVRIGIPVSDEVTQGSECGGQNTCCVGNPDAYASQHQSLENGIKSANKFGVHIFPIKANPCGDICVLDPSFGQYNAYTQLQCDCSDMVTLFMQEIADKTDGKMYELKYSSEMTRALKSAIEEAIPQVGPPLEIGNKAGFEKRQKQIEAGEKSSLISVERPIPVAVAGKYTKAFVYYWP